MYWIPSVIGASARLSKEAAGKITGDTKLEAEDKTEKAAGKIQNAVGGLKDTIRGN